MKAEHGTCWRHKYEGNYLFGGIENPELHDLELMIIITAADYKAQQAAVAAAKELVEVLCNCGARLMSEPENGKRLTVLIETARAALRALDGKDG